MQKQSSGFTLLELSIVIVIIGLIVAGISAGQSLVRQANLRNIISDYQKMALAHNTFKLQYDALPGDISNANNYWPACNSGASAAECNGDGDKTIEWAGASDADRESYRFWQHLNLANLLEGSYSGVREPANNYISCLPRGALSNTTLFISYATTAYFGRFGNGLFLDNAGSGTEAVLTSSEAKSVDQKMDDGVANTGALFGFTGTDSGLAATDCSQLPADATGADYNLATQGLSCYLVYYNFN